MWSRGSCNEFDTGLEARFAGLQYSPDGQSLTVGDVHGIIAVWDIEASRRRNDLRVGDDIYRLSFSPDASVSIVSGSSAVTVWDLVRGKRLLRRPGLGEEIGVAAAVSPDWRVIAWGGTRDNEDEDDEVGVWDVDAQHDRPGIPVEGPPVGVAGIGLSPRGRIVAWTRSMGSHIVLADLASRRVIGGMRTRGSLQGNRLAFSPDGRTLASSASSGDDDERVRIDEITLWDVETQRQLGEPIPAGVYTVMDLVWSHDGRRLASGGFYLGNLRQSPGGVSLSDASVESWRPLACRAANRNLTRAEWKLAMPGVEYHVVCPGLAATDYTLRPPRTGR
jgi:WD40 repeat protein